MYTVQWQANNSPTTMARIRPSHVRGLCEEYMYIEREGVEAGKNSMRKIGLEIICN